MNEEYDVVVCGTGLTECILSGLLSQDKKKVLHIDRNGYYGGDGASLNLTMLWKLFRPNIEPPSALGQNRDWNIDLIPKFVMGNGNLVKILLKTRVSKYLEWRPIDASFVYQWQEGGLFSNPGPVIEKVPATPSETLTSNLMGLWEKKRCKSFFEYIQKYDETKPQTTQGWNLKQMDFKAFAEKFSLQENTIDFIGHAIALWPNEDYLKKPAIESVTKVSLYMNSLANYEVSPFLYPIYGLGGIPEGFSRMSAIYGGTFMLSTDIDGIKFDNNGQVCAVTSKGEVCKTKMVICSPSYAINCGLKHKVQSVGKVIRVICILDHPIPKTNNLPSLQIIIPQKQTKRKHVSSIHCISKKGYYIAIISTNVETTNPEAELAPAYSILGPVLEKFVMVMELYEAKSDFKDNVIITNSMDATSHFESTTQNVLELYEKISGKQIDLTNLPEDKEEEYQ